MFYCTRKTRCNTENSLIDNPLLLRSIILKIRSQGLFLLPIIQQDVKVYELGDSEDHIIKVEKEASMKLLLIIHFGRY